MMMQSKAVSKLIWQLTRGTECNAYVKMREGVVTFCTSRAPKVLHKNLRGYWYDSPFFLLSLYVGYYSVPSQVPFSVFIVVELAEMCDEKWVWGTLQVIVFSQK